MKLRKILFFVLVGAMLPKISATKNRDVAKYTGYTKIDPTIHQLIPMYLPMQHQEFKTLYECGNKHEYIPSQKLISLEKRRKSWPTERRKNYHAQLGAAEAALHQLSNPCKNRAITNLKNRIHALESRINILHMIEEKI